jgi:histidine kinase-like protein
MPATSGSADEGWAAPGTPPELGDGAAWRRVFPGRECQLGILRRWLASLLPACTARDDLAIVATELGSNAIRHTASGRGGSFAVEITWYGVTARIAVADSGGPTEPRLIENPTAEHGRGLLLVHGLSVRRGVCGDHRGRLIWADVLWNGPQSAAQAARAGCFEVGGAVPAEGLIPGTTPAEGPIPALAWFTCSVPR